MGINLGLGWNTPCFMWVQYYNGKTQGTQLPMFDNNATQNSSLPSASFNPFLNKAFDHLNYVIMDDKDPGFTLPGFLVNWFNPQVLPI